MTEQDLSRRTVLKGAAVTAGALTLGPTLLVDSASAAESSPAYGTRPNFVLIMTDDQGYGDLASYGAPLINTPNIDGLGQRGIRFIDSYAGSPLCTWHDLTPPPPLAVTGGDIAWTAAYAGIGLLILGAGAFLIARRRRADAPAGGPTTS